MLLYNVHHNYTLHIQFISVRCWNRLKCTQKPLNVPSFVNVNSDFLIQTMNLYSRVSSISEAKQLSYSWVFASQTNAKFSQTGLFVVLTVNCGFIEYKPNWNIMVSVMVFQLSLKINIYCWLFDFISTDFRSIQLTHWIDVFWWFTGFFFLLLDRINS